jgi:hypothetical protein
MSAKALLEWAAEDTAETAEFRPSLFVEPAPSTVH